MNTQTDVPFNYLGLDPNLSDFDRASVLIWPVPLEKTVSYGRGTKDGPKAIIDASRYLELYDEEIGGETALIGIHTLPAIDVNSSLESMIEALRSEARSLLRTGKFLCSLGGEHSISAPIVHAFSETFPNLSVLQIDAHADLRESYEGSPYSHASAMRRIVEVCPAVQVGIRSISSEEVRALPGLRTRIFYAKDIVGRSDWIDTAIDSLSENVYLTFDVDGLDPSLIPATGTPEPGGLGWYEVLVLLKRLGGKRRVVGMDFVELCGCSDNQAPSFLTAKLIYKTLGYIFRNKIPALIPPAETGL